MTRIIQLISISLTAVLLLTSCTYLKYTSIQAKYSQIQNTDPSQMNLKHMLERETFFVFGKTLDESDRYTDVSIAIAAYSNEFKQNERVDTMFSHGTETHYGLNLPAGQYHLVVYADVNEDNIFDQSELVGERKVTLDKISYPEKIVSHTDIVLTDSKAVISAEPILMPEVIKTKKSIYYPAGTIRSLNDPLFNENISTLGMYDPASFLELAPTMFYALEEDFVHKIPVVFVHGIGGSSRAFSSIISRMDRDRYKPWFFYYPSGGDLDQLADFFYSLFLSGEVITLSDMPMIVIAHSMGGLVVREAFNEYEGKTNENKVDLFVTIASPLGGHPSAAYGEENGLIVLPAWRDLNPNSEFIEGLYRKPLPSFINHQLFYAYKNSDTLKFGENSDGVVPLFSQLHPEAQAQSSQQFGFNSGHVDILENDKMISHLLGLMSKVENLLSDASMKILADGGFDVKLSSNYSPNTKHLIKYAGRYLVLLSHSRIEQVIPQQAHFIRAIQKEIPATTNLEREFIMFMKEYPEIINNVLDHHNNSLLGTDKLKHNL